MDIKIWHYLLNLYIYLVSELTMIGLKSWKLLEF